MPTYMLQGSYTKATINTMINNPEDRGKALEALITNLGGKMISLYYTMGEDDFVLISEFSDDTTAMTSLVAGLATGDLQTYRTSKLFTLEETKVFLRQAGKIVSDTQSS